MNDPQHTDSSAWRLTSSSQRDGEPRPEPAPTVQTENSMVCTPTPEPDSKDIIRNFGYTP